MQYCVLVYWIIKGYLSGSCCNAGESFNYPGRINTMIYVGNSLTKKCDVTKQKLSLYYMPQHLHINKSIQFDLKFSLSITGEVLPFELVVIALDMSLWLGSQLQ